MNNGNHSGKKTLRDSAQTVQDALLKKKLALEVLELPSSTRTANAAAATIGCDVAQIIKSLLFKTIAENLPILILASGINQVNEKKLEQWMGAAAGTPNAVFRLYSRDLEYITEGKVIRLHKRIGMRKKYSGIILSEN